MNIERAITSGSVLVVRNVNEALDSIFIPLIYQINTAQKDQAVNDGKYCTSKIFMMSVIKHPLSLQARIHFILRLCMVLSCGWLQSLQQLVGTVKNSHIVYH